MREVTPQAAAPAAGKYFIKTFGCQMNVADSERMAALLAEQGLTEASGPEDAQVVLINGCSVREKAVHKAVSALGLLQPLKAGGQGPVIGLGGCVGQLAAAGKVGGTRDAAKTHLGARRLFKRAPYLDFIFGTDAIDQLPELVYRARQGERQFVQAEFDPSMDYSTETKVLGHKAQAYVNIMKGCDKYCTYCIVPFTRGREKSRLIAEVVDDVARLVARGVREVTLLGQNVNSFGKGNASVGGREPRELHNAIGKVGPRAGDENFPQLLRAIDQDPRCAELRRIRFTSSHPLDFSDELIDCYALPEKGGVARLSPHLHLPVQCGSNRVLQKMGRHHTIESYVAQMARLRELNPEIGFSTDLIVGFPTETDAEFEETIALLDRVQFDNIYAFAYSSRPGTRAAKLPDDVPAEVKNARLNRLLQHQLKIAEKRYADRVGKVMEILVEGPAKNERLGEGAGGTVWTGRTGCNRVVNFVSRAPRAYTGRFVDVKITGATALSLEGEVPEEWQGKGASA